jgi:hypothetical protein
LRVVPIDYRLSAEERHTIYDKINGIYFPGDSQMSITDDAYKEAFVDALNYQEDQVYNSKEHFPLFLMGNSFTTLTRARGSVNGNLKDMGNMMYESFSLKTVSQPHETFFFD